MLLLCTIALLMQRSRAECEFKYSDFECTKADSKSIMFDFNSKTRNSTTIRTFRFASVDSESIQRFLSAVDEEIKFNIQEIGMNHCDLTEPPDISGYQHLETLDARHNKISTVPEVFSDFERLELVDLSHCEIDNLNFIVFKNNQNLRLVNVSNNNIRSTESDEYLKNVRCVDLSRNPLAKYSNVPGLCLDFSYTDMAGYQWYNVGESNKTVMVEQFRFSGNGRLKLRAISAGNISLPITVQYLDLSQYRGDVGDLDLEQVKVSKSMSLKGSERIVLDKSKRDFVGLFFEEGTNATFDLSNCSIDLIPDGYFEGINLGRLDLCYNHIDRLNSNVFKDSYIVQLDLCRNDIGEIDERAFDNLHVGLLNLSGNKISKNLEFLKPITAIHHLDLSNNRIASLSSGSFDTPTLETINLRGNSISIIDNGGVFANKNVRIVVLSDNNLSGIREGTFANSPGLREVNLDGNPIRFIDANSFADLPALRTVSLKGTEVYVIKNNAFANVGNLEKVYLDNNEVNDLHLICKLFK
ncbi:unnamed protein product [Phyllotreta striolata]|uniref:Uncharacterized protein n=1 Tax=Phyllotreta striolata TaxID=444603 RepID=A0A9N9TT46_PHYSR|nr:unnamed protein product [Phyllotreta striolata]